MIVTIATHNGSSLSRDHNRRLPHYVRAQGHIDPHGHYEVWRDEDPRVAYNRIFGDAVADYNSRQTREDRRIADYYKKIAGSKKQHAVYEMIIGVYSPREGAQLDQATCREILQEFYDGWQQRNPNLELIGAYFHADEQGADPHLHLDYVPVASGYKNGPEIQAGLGKALEAQGFVKHGRDTGQIRWERRENAVLEELCRAHGLEVRHPDRDGERERREHLQTDLYKAQAERDHVIEQTRELEHINERDRARLVSQLQWASERNLWRNIFQGHKRPDGSVVYTRKAAERLEHDLLAIQDVVWQLSRTTQDAERQYAAAEEFAQAAKADRAKAAAALQDAERIRRDAERLRADLERDVAAKAYELVRSVVQRQIDRSMIARRDRQERLYEYLHDHYDIDVKEAFEAYETSQAAEIERLAREALAEQQHQLTRARDARLAEHSMGR